MVAYANLDWQNAILTEAHRRAFADLKNMWASRLLGRIVRIEKRRVTWSARGRTVVRPPPYDGRWISDAPAVQAKFDRADLTEKIVMIEDTAWSRISVAERLIPRLARSRPTLELWHKQDGQRALQRDLL